MATNFPTSLDSLTNPTSSNALNSPSHSGQHADANDAIEALQAKVGVDNSAVTTSLDYRVRNIDADSAIVEGSTSGDLVRITQTGTGNALVVEDSTNPDSTPFVVTADGRVFVGSTSASNTDTALEVNTALGGIGSYRYANSISSATLRLGKSRSDTIGGHTAVQNNDGLARLAFLGSDGSAFVIGARIEALVDGTPGTNIIPGKMQFHTANSSGTLTHRLEINASGAVTVQSGGSLSTPTLTVDGIEIDTTGATSGQVLQYDGTKFAPNSSPTLTTPVLGTPSSGTLSNCTVDGTNKVGFLKVPVSGSEKTTSYTLATGDIGEYIQVGTGGSVTIPNNTFAQGDIISVVNNTAGNITITCSTTNAYIAGVNTNRTSVTLSTRGIACILFLSGTSCLLSGNVA
jgi:hypothetical protein